ncbi:hypothetical protein [Stagnimonas aquatica]|uniref:hypothetical protein n=1 Tax=Stagnimonas aquatica TaxID=2689987 RepID=UPI0011CE029D|nr:hypothetical protein [Stagnimonas aquatica]
MTDPSEIAVRPSGTAPYLRAVAECFHRRPDAAGILQGVRPMRQGVPHTRIVLVPSSKNGGTIACEGRLEAALAKNLEIDPFAARFRGQPFSMPGPMSRKVVCDFAVQQSDGIYLVVDVKPSGQLASARVAERMRHVRSLLADSFVPHRIVTELDLERQPARQIRDQLWKGVDAPVTAHQRDGLLGFVRRGPVTVGQAREFCRSERLPVFAIEKLVIRNFLSFEINAPWGSKTLIGDRHESHSSARAVWGSVQDVVVRL